MYVLQSQSLQYPSLPEVRGKGQNNDEHDDWSSICVHAIDDAEDKVLASVNGENPEWCEMAEQPQEDGDEMESGFLFGSFFVPFSGVMRM